MSHTSGTAELTELREHWQRWASVVAQIAQGRKGRQPISGPKYRELHSRLLQSCRAAAEALDDSKQSEVQRIESLVRPWMTVDSLTGAGRKNAERLFGQCQQVNVIFRDVPAKSRSGQGAALGGGRKSGVLVLVAAFVLGIGITLLALNWNELAAHTNPKFDAQLWIVWLKFKIRHLGFFKTFSIITLVTIVIGGILMYTTKKS